ncbi:MAG: competence/damage-inducible protein A [Candidatus Omnitrophica bacterium]|nr:competence/damage-inducible protein A [Candidatus Omnitrophota bacterium]
MKYKEVNAEIIGIGSELLLGHIVNTNARYLSRQLSKIGVDVFRQAVVGDNAQRIKDAVETALERADIVITTGGLGPTVDDITVKSITDSMGRALVLDEKILGSIKRFFKERSLKMHDYVIKQAYVPEKSISIRNPVGTAPGIIIEYGQKTIVVLPGPPRELIPIFEKYVTQYLSDKYHLNTTIFTRTIRTVGVPESHINRRIKKYLAMRRPVTVGIYARINEVDIKITAKAKSERGAVRKIKKVENELLKILGDMVYGFDDDSLESVVAEKFRRKGLRLSVAESCTGGLISSRITDVPGSSRYFERGYVTYSNRSKVTELGVKETLLKKCGAVSRRVAIAMAEGAMVKSGSEVALAVTGIAGPSGGTKEKPVGLVHIAMATKGKTISVERRFLASRQDFKRMVSNAALDILRKQC